ncbi:MAG: hypothetical protein KGI70_01785 [Patescibacteria group bacterium]|nr:hypothetical protein [Patescibacteria group bacterium]
MPQENDGVEDLKHKLYSRKGQKPMQDVRAPLTPHETQAPVSWGPPVKPPEPTRMINRYEEPYASRRGVSRAAKFLAGAGIFFVAALAFALYTFFAGNNLISPNNIDISIAAPSLIDGGKEAQLQILITNRNTSPLQLADLVLDYPPGTRSADDPTQSLTHERISLGTVEPGQQIKKVINAVFYGSEGQQETLHASLEYSVAGSNAIFNKDIDQPLTIGSSPISLNVQAPPEVTAGEPFNVTVTLQSNATEPTQNVAVEAQYPFGFTLQSATPKPAVNTTLWRLGSLTPGQIVTLNLRAVLDGQDGDQRVVRFLVGQNTDPTDATVKVPFLTTPITITVRKPFISANLSTNGQSGATAAAPAGSAVQGSIAWVNNLGSAVSNVTITLTLSGPTLDKSSVQGGTGFYQSQNSTITWGPEQDPSLAQVSPGQNGELQFSFSTLPPGQGGTVYTNPTVVLNVAVSGTRQDETGAPQTVSSADTQTVSLTSATALSTDSFFTQGPYANSGPTPPKADSATTYSVRWSVKNSSNTIANATAQTVLPQNVQFVQGQSGVTFDPGSRTVRWSIGDLNPGVGYSTSALSAYFQVSITPSQSQLGLAPALTGSTQLSGTDRFSGASVSASAPGPTTATKDGTNGIVGQ